MHVLVLTIEWFKVVFDFTLPLFVIVCRTTGMAHLKVNEWSYACSRPYASLQWIRTTLICLFTVFIGLYSFLQNLGATAKCCSPEVWQEISSHKQDPLPPPLWSDLLPYFYLTLSVRCVYTDTHCCMFKRKTYWGIAENDRRHGTKFRSPGDQVPAVFSTLDIQNNSRYMKRPVSYFGSNLCTSVN